MSKLNKSVLVRGSEQLTTAMARKIVGSGCSILELDGRLGEGMPKTKGWRARSVPGNGYR
jgi:hypothetical protein